jgi:hypothetical protein
MIHFVVVTLKNVEGPGDISDSPDRVFMVLEGGSVCGSNLRAS